MSDRIAIDIVLLPPTEIGAWVTESNRQLLRAEDGFAIDATHLPHLSLLQQCVRGEVIEHVIARVDEVVRGVRSLPLVVPGCRRTGTTAHALVTPTAELRALHVALFDVLEPFVESNVPTDAFSSAGDEPPRQRDIEWVEHFRENASRERFEPHITLGIGPAPELERALPFTADRVAVCRLGRYCTCREILAEWRLQ